MTRCLRTANRTLGFEFDSPRTRTWRSLDPITESESMLDPRGGTRAGS